MPNAVSEGRWICVRQRAGPLVKECRALRPRLSAADTPYQRAEKNKILQPPKDSAVCRSSVDRLELRLALFGFGGSHYALTFDEEHLPHCYADLHKAWRSFKRRLQLWHGGKPFDYIYIPEGLHGDHRYHIHVILRDADFPPVIVRALWRFGGDVDDEPLLRGPYDSYRRLAVYLSKERRDGTVHPVGSRSWVASRSLNAKLPPPERFTDGSGFIHIPRGVRISGTYATRNEFGQYHYAWYINGKNSTKIE